MPRGRGDLRFVVGGAPDVGAIAPGNAELLGNLSQRLQGFSRTMQRTGINAADRETQIYLGEQSAAIDKKLSELETQYESDPAGWENAAKAYLDGVLSEAPENLRPFVQIEAQHKTRVIGKGIKNRFEQNLDSEVESRIRGELERTQGHLERAVRDGDDEAAAFHGGKLDLLVRLGAGEQADSTLGAAQAFSTGRRVFTPAQETAYRERAASAVRVQSVLGEFERTGDKRSFVKQVEAGKGLAADLLPDERDQLVNRFQREIEHEDALYREAQSAREKIVTDQVGDVVARLSAGFPVGEDEIVQARRNASGFGDLRESLSRAEHNAANMRVLRRMPEEEARRTLAAFKAEKGLSKEDVRFVLSAEQQMGEEFALRASDPLEAAERSGLVELGEIDLDNPDTIRARLDAAEKGKAVWGTPNVSPLKKTETAALALQYREQKDPGPRVEFLEKVYQAVGPKHMDAVMGSLAKEGSGIAAVAGSLMAEGAKDVAQRVVDGQVWLNDAKVGAISEEVWRPALTAKLGDVLAHDPEMLSQVVTAAKSYEASVRGESGSLEKPVLGDEGLDRAIDAVTGGVHEISTGRVFGDDFKIISPVRGLSNSEAQTWFEGLSGKDFAGVADAERVAKAVKDHGKLRTTTAGGKIGYFVFVGEEQVTTEDGRPFVLRYAPPEPPNFRLSDFGRQGNPWGGE